MLTTRAYRDAADLRQMVNLLLQDRSARDAHAYPSPSDLHELVAVASGCEDVRLWFDESGALIASALVDSYNNLVFQIDAAQTDWQLEREIVAFGVERLRARANSDQDMTLDASCSARDRARVALLLRNGFVQRPERSIHLLRSLHDPIAPPRLPEGCVIRPSEGAAEADEWVRLHRQAFGTEHMTVDERLAMLEAPSYDPQGDLVLVAPDGRLVAYCMCQIDHEENARRGRQEGCTDPIATHPAYQRRRLASALLSAGLLLLRKRGMDWAAMGTNSENERLLRLALAAGFQVESTRLRFSRAIELSE